MKNQKTTVILGIVYSVLCVYVLLITHIIDFAMKIPNIILSPKDYAFTILIFITAVAGMVCGLCFRSKKKIYLILLGVSYVVLVGMYVMRMTSAIAQMYSRVFSPVSVVIVNIIKPIALLAAICVFAYYVFVRDEC